MRPPTEPRDADQILEWVQRVVEDACFEAGLGLSGDGVDAFRRVWTPSCQRFVDEGRVGVRLRAGAAEMSFMLKGAAATMVQSARLHGHLAVEADDVERGMLAFSILKPRTPHCPPEPEIVVLRQT